MGPLNVPTTGAYSAAFVDMHLTGNLAHAEGLAVPADFVHDLHGFDSNEVRAIMRDNALSLIGA